ncbi:transcriptional regulator, partial [Pseudomonas sp. O230]
VQGNAQGHYENDSRIPRGDYLVRLYTAGFDVQFILTGVRTDLDNTTVATDEHPVLEAFRLLQVADRQAVEKIIFSLAKKYDRINN